MEELLEIKAKVKTIRSEDFEKFNDYFNTLWAAEAPLRAWCLEKLREACAKTGTWTLVELHTFCYKGDGAQAATFKLMKENGWTEGQRDAECARIQTLYEDEEMFVRCSIDYDCDTTLCKYIVKHKASGLVHRSSVDLGEEHLQRAFVRIVPREAVSVAGRVTDAGCQPR